MPCSLVACRQGAHALNYLILTLVMDKTDTLDFRIIEKLSERMGHIEAQLEILLQYNKVSHPVRPSYGSTSVSAGSRSFFRFMQRQIQELQQEGRVRTGETYAAALRSFRRFRHDKDVSAGKIDSDMIRQYEGFLMEQGLSKNTVSFYMRILRAAYNRAVETGITLQRYPFRHVYTGVDKTVKRAIPLEDIRRIKRLDLSLDPSLEWARDLFMFSFYTRGMSFVDMAYLKKTDLDGGILSYKRRKTGQRLVIRWERCMQEIVERYSGNTTDYLLPIITRPEAARRQYQNALHLANRRLKVISGMARLRMNLSMYVARHSWASIAKCKHVPLSVISKGMGHDSEATTQIYLVSLDNSQVDKANRLIIGEL